MFLIGKQLLAPIVTIIIYKIIFSKIIYDNSQLSQLIENEQPFPVSQFYMVRKRIYAFSVFHKSI